MPMSVSDEILEWITFQTGKIPREIVHALFCLVVWLTGRNCHQLEFVLNFSCVCSMPVVNCQESCRGWLLLVCEQVCVEVTRFYSACGCMRLSLTARVKDFIFVLPACIMQFPADWSCPGIWISAATCSFDPSGICQGTCPCHWISRYGTKWHLLCWYTTATQSHPPHWLYHSAYRISVLFETRNWWKNTVASPWQADDSWTVCYRFVKLR